MRLRDKILLKLGYWIERASQGALIRRFPMCDFGGGHITVSKDTLIGDYTYVGDYSLITRARIGRYSSIGSNVVIGPGEHKVERCSTSAYVYDKTENWYDLLTEKEVVIGNDVWIGTNSIVRRGVKIGNGAVVGANSFVNHDVPEYAIVAGNPARMVKMRFDDEIMRQIIESRWWDYNKDEATEIIKDLDVFITDSIRRKE